MGQLPSCARSTEVCPPPGVRIVHITGEVEDFPTPVKVKQVLQQHPRHFVCRWQDLAAINSRRRLATEDELSMGELYLVLPISALDSNLSPKTLAGLARRLLNAARKGASKVAQGRSGDSKLHYGSSICSMYEKIMQSCNNPELQKAYKEHLIAKARSWRPQLHTIQETCFSC